MLLDSMDYKPNSILIRGSWRRAKQAGIETRIGDHSPLGILTR